MKPIGDDRRHCFKNRNDVGSGLLLNEGLS